MFLVKRSRVRCKGSKFTKIKFRHESEQATTQPTLKCITNSGERYGPCCEETNQNEGKNVAIIHNIYCVWGQARHADYS